MLTTSAPPAWQSLERRSRSSGPADVDRLKCDTESALPASRAIACGRSEPLVAGSTEHAETFGTRKQFLQELDRLATISVAEDACRPSCCCRASPDWLTGRS